VVRGRTNSLGRSALIADAGGIRPSSGTAPRATMAGQHTTRAREKRGSMGWYLGPKTRFTVKVTNSLEFTL